jgi:hypothetical protein
MNTNSDAMQESPFVRVGRFLGRSNAGRCLVSIGILALFCCAAYMAWHDHELAAYVLTAWLVIYGVQMAWNLLPISEATRSRWRTDRQIAERCSAAKYRVLLWVGIGVIASEWVSPGPGRGHALFDYVIPGAIVASGAVSYILCYRFVHREQRT